MVTCLPAGRQEVRDKAFVTKPFQHFELPPRVLVQLCRLQRRLGQLHGGGLRLTHCGRRGALGQQGPGGLPRLAIGQTVILITPPVNPY